MKRTVLTTLILIYGSVLFAQSEQDTSYTRAENNISLSLSGDASLISLSYERLFYFGSYFALASKLGVGYSHYIELWQGTGNQPEYLTIPHHITGNIGKNGLFIELGLGGTLRDEIGQWNNASYVLYPIFGLRVMSEKRKMSLRIYMQSPIVGEYVGFWQGEKYIPGYSFGYFF